MQDPDATNRILGVHPVNPTDDEFREAVEIQWGEGLVDSELADAEASVREHFDRLYLIELRIDPANDDFDWSSVTQPVEGQPRENWQAAYDEQEVDAESGRWAFFFHDLDLRRPLRTSCGDFELPAPSPVPPHLSTIRYELP